MKELIGFWLISEAITIMIVVITVDLDFIGMIKTILLFTIFLTMLCIGSYLLVGA